MSRLDGKVALLSGAARGIGGETAKLMAAAGAKVVIGDVLDEVGRQTVAAINAGGGNAEYIHLDVTKEADWTAAANLAVANYGKLDVLVNNAGVFIGKGIEDISMAEWQRLVDVNMTGVFLALAYALLRCATPRKAASMAVQSSTLRRSPASSARSLTRYIQ